MSLKSATMINIKDVNQSEKRGKPSPLCYDNMPPSKKRSDENSTGECAVAKAQIDAVNDNLLSSSKSNCRELKKRSQSKALSEKEDSLDCLNEILIKLPGGVATDYYEYLQKLYANRLGTLSELTKIHQSICSQSCPKPLKKHEETSLQYPGPINSEENQTSQTSKSLRVLRCRSKCTKKPFDAGSSSKSEDCAKRDAQLFKCDICGVKFKTQRYSIEHSVKVHGVKRYKCLICDDRFFRKPEMYRHVKTHTGSDGIQCPVCLKLYKRFDSFLQHMNKMHLKDVQLPCPECGLVFRSSWLLKSHSLVHTKKWRFVCQLCDKGFPVKTCFMDHLNIHSGLKPYKCEHCGKCFRSQPIFRDHSKVHNDNLKHSCSVCEKSFVTVALLNKHVRIHESHKKFECKECGKKFKLPQTLVSHRVVHRGHNRLSKLSSKECDLQEKSDNSHVQQNIGSNDDSDEDYNEGGFITTISPLDSIEINKNPLDFGNGLFGILNDDCETEDESDCERDTTCETGYEKTNRCSVDNANAFQKLEHCSTSVIRGDDSDENYHLTLSESSSSD